MKDLILEALKETIKRYPETLKYLDGTTRWAVGLVSIKKGEAPDDERRLKDENKLASAFAVFFQGQLERILKQIKREYKSFQPEFWEEEARLMWDDLSEYFVGIIIHGLDGGLDLLKEHTGRVNRDMVNMAVMRYAKQYRNEWLSNITNTTRKYVEQTITNWIQSGDPLNELVKTLSNPDIGMFGKDRARRIAVTETTRLHAMGNQLSWEESGVVDEFYWMTAEDEAVCNTCIEWSKGSPYPLARMTEIPAHVNCRCWAQPHVNLQRVNEGYDWTRD